MGPIHLGLGAGWGLDPASGPYRRSRIGARPVALDRAHAPGVAVFRLQPPVQGGKVKRTSALHLTPVVDRRRNASRFELLPGSAVERSRLHARDVVANRALGHA